MKKLAIKNLSLKNKLRKPRINTKKVIAGMLVAGFVLSIGSGVVAYNKLYLTQERRFWLALDNSMRTQSVVKEVQQGGSGNKQIDKVRFSFGANPQVNKITSISEKSATSDSNVTTENLQTVSEEFIRYLNISTDQKKEDGAEYDFSTIKNQWAKQEVAASEEDAAERKLSFAQLHVTLAPFGNLTANDRREIINELKNEKAYDIAYEAVTNQEVEGVSYVIYPLKVQTKKYVSVLQKHFIKMGYGTFPPLNPENYPDNARVNAEFLVRKSDNVLAGIVFNGLSERYSNYGVAKRVTVPTSYISVEELQTKLGSLQ